jgi:hypothetical protein
MLFCSYPEAPTLESLMMFCLTDQETGGEYENLCLLGFDVMEASHFSRHIQVSCVLYPEVITAEMSSLKISVFLGCDAV